MWRSNRGDGHTASLPAGQATCHPCRRARREAEEQAKPIRQVGRTCEVCGQQYRHTYTGQRTCGRACGVTLKRTVTGAMPNAWPASPVLIRDCLGCARVFVARSTSRTYCSTPCARTAERARYQPKAGQVVARTCGRCNVPIAWLVTGSGRPPKHCGPCATVVRRDVSSRRRARLRGADVEQIDRPYVFDRDGWRCQLCGKAVPRGKAHPHPLSASLDHVVPLASGGDHVTSNVQLAHLRCNVRKGARGGGEQLSLIG